MTSIRPDQIPELIKVINKYLKKNPKISATIILPNGYRLNRRKTTRSKKPL